MRAIRAMDATTALAVISIVAAVAIFVYLALAPSAHESSKAGMSAAAAPKAAAPAPVARPELKDFTIAELAEYNGTDASKPLLLAADGFVFDVSAGRTFYGPGGPYGKMAGRDASIALATMEVDPANCTKKIVSELSMAEQQVLLDWVSKYRMKYPVMGFLTEGSHPVTVAEAKTKGWDK